MLRTADFQPDWVSPPQETIRALLKKRGISTERFAASSGCDLNEFEALLNADIAIDKYWSEVLQRVLGVPADFWIRLQEQFSRERSALSPDDDIADEKSFVRSLPISSMRKLGWIDCGQDLGSRVAAAFQFFDVESVAEFRSKFGSTLSAVAFREATALRSNPASVLAWLNYAERAVTTRNYGQWDREAFQASLSEIRKLTRMRDPKVFVPRLTSICSRCGVAFVLVPPPEGCRASGATRFIAGDKALIVMSLRYKTDDQFWFTFFHEAGHLILHSNKALFLEDGSEVTIDEEDEANEFAGRMLVPESFWEDVKGKRLDYKSIIAMAHKLGVSPGVLVGQMQHFDLLDPSKMNFLKRRYAWTKDGEAALIP